MIRELVLLAIFGTAWWLWWKYVRPQNHLVGWLLCVYLAGCTAGFGSATNLTVEGRDVDFGALSVCNCGRHLGLVMDGAGVGRCSSVL